MALVSQSHSHVLRNFKGLENREKSVWWWWIQKLLSLFGLFGSQSMEKRGSTRVACSISQILWTTN